MEAIVSSLSEQAIQGEVTDIFQQIDSLIGKLLAAESKLDHGYAQLGGLLTEVLEKELWREAGHKSFDVYLKSVSEKYNRGKTQLWHYLSSVREMRPYLTETQMNEIGISKLNVLKRATKELGFPPNSEVIQTALDPAKTVSDVRKAVAENHKLTPEEQDGTWFELPGFFVSAEEKLVLTEAFEAAWRTDPVVQKGKEGPRAKEAILRLAMEYLAGHGDSAEAGVA